MRLRVTFLALFVAIGPAMAEEHPLMRPSRDVEVLYQSSGGRGDSTVTMHFTASSGRIRYESGNGQGAVILDTDTGRMTVLMAEKHMYMERPADPNMTPMMRASAAHLTKTGSDKVAGIPCTLYDGDNNGRKGQACLTDDGVLLRARDADGKQTLEAMKVTYAAQPASLFEPPSGYQKFEMPNIPGMPPGMGGAGIGGAGMGARGMMPNGMPNGMPPR